MRDAVIEIPNHLTIKDLDIGIDISHSQVFDLQIFLESPSGTKVCLNMYDIDEYFQGEDYMNIIFDDEANIPIAEAGQQFIGRFKPKDPLSAFDGEDAFGLWRLQIYDAYYADTGSLNNFSIVVTVIEPATAILLMAGVVLALFLRPRRITYR